MTSTKFHFIPSKRADYSKGRLFIRVIHKRKIKHIRTDYQLFPDEWDSLDQKVIGTKEYSERNNYLNHVIRCMDQDLKRLEYCIAQVAAEKKDYNVNDIVDKFLGPESKETINGYCQVLVNSLKHNGQLRTARAYESATKRFLEFTKNKNTPLKIIDRNLIREYEKFLLDNGLQMNTISFYMRNLRAIYNRAIDEGIIQAQQDRIFCDVYTGVYETRRRALSQNDMVSLQQTTEKLEKFIKGMDSSDINEKEYIHELNRNTSLKHALFYFLFSYHARGMSFIDLAYLQKTSICKEVIRYKRKKTGGYFEIKITVPMKQIIRYFKEQNPDSKYLFPIINENKANEYAQYEKGLRKQNIDLGILGNMIGLEKKVTTHVARHTYATLAKRANIPLPVISEALGHRDTKITYKYLDSFEQSTLDELSSFMSRMIHEKTGKNSLCKKKRHLISDGNYLLPNY